MIANYMSAAVEPSCLGYPSMAHDFLFFREQFPGYRLDYSVQRSDSAGTSIWVRLRPPKDYGAADRPFSMSLKESDLEDILTYYHDTKQTGGGDYKALTMALHYLRCHIAASSAPGLR